MRTDDLLRRTARTWNGRITRLFGCILMYSASAFAQAGDVSDRYPQIISLFPDADHFGPIEGKPPAAPIYKDGRLMGYVFNSTDAVQIPGYSGQPIALLVGIDMSGLITGVALLDHHEAILDSHFPKGVLERFLATYIGKSIRDHIRIGAPNRPEYVNIDAISSATVTSLTINRSILESARAVALARGIIHAPPPRVPAAPVRMDLYEPADWRTLTGNGAIRHLRVTGADLEHELQGTIAAGHLDAVMDPEECRRLALPESCDIVIDMYYALLDPPTIGRNLLGDADYRALMRQLKPGEHAIMMVANGIYSFKGTAYVVGGIFDRIHLIQRPMELTFRDSDYTRLDTVAADGAPRFTEGAIFIVPATAGFQPGAPWALELRIRRQVSARDGVSVTFNAEYELPQKYLQ